MLQRTAAATAEMRARRIGAPTPRGHPLDDPPFASAASSGAETRPDAIARHRKGQKDRFAVVVGDAVPARPDPRYGELHEPVGLFSSTSFQTPTPLGHGFARASRSLSNARGDLTLVAKIAEFDEASHDRMLYL